MLLGTSGSGPRKRPSLPPIVVRGVGVDRRDGREVMRAVVDGKDVWYDFSGVTDLQVRAEPFLSAALFPAMALGRDVEIQDAPLSIQLLESLGQVQRLIKLWNPEAHLIEVIADTQKIEARPELIVSSFSGGIDSMSTLMRHSDDITHLLSINGFDGMNDNDWEQAEARFKEYAERLERQSILIDSNLYFFLEEYGISWRYAHGSVLASLMAVIGAPRGYIASTFTGRDLAPWGSHPILDPLWSTETTQIIHDAIELTRSDKIAVVASDPAMLAQTQVCWRSKVENCGKCSKCVRTMLALELLGLGVGPFPKADAVDRLNKLKPVTDLEAAVIWDLWKLAEQRERTDIAERLHKMLQRYKLKRAARKLAKEMIGPRWSRRIHELQGREWVDEPMLLGDPTDFK